MDGAAEFFLFIKGQVYNFFLVAAFGKLKSFETFPLFDKFIF